MRAKRWVVSLATVLGMIALAIPVLAQERDSDGTRMQARQVDVGTTHSEELAPPADKADWRMIRLEEEATITLELTVRPVARSAKLTLTGSTGDELAAKSAGREKATIQKTLDAGIYYISVESSESLRYELSIR